MEGLRRGCGPGGDSVPCVYTSELGDVAKLEKERRAELPFWLSWYRDPVLIVAIAVVFSLDQITKALVRHSLLLYESVPREGVVRITHISNTGSAFGLFTDQTMFLILGSFVGIAILLLVSRNQTLPNLPLRLSLGMQVGGAVGNLVDRLRMGLVTDFIDLGFWPVFNIADSSIVIGLAIIVWLFLSGGREARRPGTTLDSGYTQGGERRAVAAFMNETGGDTGAPGGSQPVGVHVVDGGPCPICGVAMEEAPGGWRCPGCGVREWVEETEQW